MAFQNNMIVLGPEKDGVFDVTIRGPVKKEDLIDFVFDQFQFFEKDMIWADKRRTKTFKFDDNTPGEEIDRISEEMVTYMNEAIADCSA